MTRIERRLTRYSTQSRTTVGRRCSSAYDSDTAHISRRLTCLFREISKGIQLWMWGESDLRKSSKKKRKRKRRVPSFQRTVEKPSSAKHFKFQDGRNRGWTDRNRGCCTLNNYTFVERREPRYFDRVCFVIRGVERDRDKTCIYSDWLIG